MGFPGNHFEDWSRLISRSDRVRGEPVVTGDRLPVVAAPDPVTLPEPAPITTTGGGNITLGTLDALQAQTQSNHLELIYRKAANKFVHVTKAGADPHPAAIFK